MDSAKPLETCFYTWSSPALSPVANWSSSLGASPARARGSSRGSRNMVRLGSEGVRFRTVIRKEVVMDPGIGVMDRRGGATFIARRQE